ncbi:hypothetical protein [Arthrobacter sp. ZGTC412]|uniref:hypothetical protein n=1 Tax=Arthrobacter sp. ZGTC412 TaxID=2058900 RepID=UPI0011B015E2|nr:hypothetical protein [Arthrobacter sp. ZGTC412]
MAISGAREKPRMRNVLVPAGIACLFVAVAAAIGPGVVWGDTVQYLRIAYMLQGVSENKAWLDAYTLWCKHPSFDYKGTLENCISTTMAGHGPFIGYIDRNVPYQEIFTPRIGYPMLSIPLMHAFGDRIGLWIVAVAATTIGGLVLVRILRIAGLGVVSSTVAQFSFYALPVSLPHGVAMLAEATTLTSALVMALGLAYVIRGSNKRGLTWVTLGLGLVFFFKYSSTLLLCLSFLVVCLGLLLLRQYRRNRQIRFAAFLSGVALILSSTVNSLLGFPGLSHSLQDTFTDHFRLPPVDDPVVRLLQLEWHFLGRFVAGLPANATYLAVFLAGVAGFVLALRSRRFRPEIVVTVALSLYGVLSVVGHPVHSQAPRLGSSLWVGIAVGLGLLLFELWQRRRPSPFALSESTDNSVPPSKDG